MSSIFTVTQINNQCKNILEKNFSNIWIKGEISSPNLYPSGHMYFILKDDKSEISCVFFNYNKKEVLQDGQELTLSGKISMYPQKGKYQFIAKDLYHTGLGALFQKYNFLKKKLKKEGLFEDNHKKNIPKYAINIGLVTSLKGAVINDICNILKRRAPYVNLFISDTPVQGFNISNNLIESLKILDSYKKIDLVIIARGGGSFEDLMPFNDESLVRCIFSLKTPIISAIGHETDFTLCDFVSDFRASTPSEAAEISAVDIKDIFYHIDDLYDKITKIIHSRIESMHVKLNLLNSRIPSNPIKLIDSKLSKLFLLVSFINKIINDKILSLNSTLNSKINILNLSNPKNIKKRGYSIVKFGDKVISNANRLRPDDVINIDFHTGLINAKIIKIKKD